MNRILLVLVIVSSVLCGCDNSTSNAPVRSAGQASTGSVIQWTEAAQHIGQSVTIEGPIVSSKYASSSKGQPTFLNVGKAYPDPTRFTILIWGSSRSNFPSAPESMYQGKTVRVTGTVQEYKGSTEIVVSSPVAIQVIR